MVLRVVVPAGRSEPYAVLSKEDGLALARWREDGEVFCVGLGFRIGDAFGIGGDGVVSEPCPEDTL